MVRDLVLKNRSYRRFYQEREIPMADLEALTDLARLTPSGMNLQALKYALSVEKTANAAIFETLGWAGYLKEWPGPEEGERPSAYVIVLKDLSIGKGLAQDEGIAIQSLLLGAVEMGYGGCIFGNVNRSRLSAYLNLPEHLEISLVVALGVPKECVQLDEISESGDVKYWRDPQQVHHVPKRRLDQVIAAKFE